jgi:polyisoprenoid-binding protein YceI
MKQLFLALATLGLVFCANAAEIDASASQFKWTGKKVTGQHYGTLPVKSSDLMVKGGKIVGGTIVLDISKMTVDDLSGDYAKKFLTHMMSEDFFEVKKWPTAKLVIEKVQGNKAMGKLTVKDKTNPVEFTYSQSKGMYSGTLKFDRTKFGMIYGSGDFFKGLGDKMIYNDVTLDFKVKVKGV